MTDSTDKELKPWQFKSGQSGNPNGRPKGSRNKATLALQELLDGEAEEIGRKAIEFAKSGDVTAIRLVLERVLPAKKDSPLLLDIKKPTSSAEITEAMGLVVESVGLGDITPAEGRAMVGLLDSLRKSMELTEIEKRLRKLEAANER